MSKRPVILPPSQDNESVLAIERTTIITALEAELVQARAILEAQSKTINDLNAERRKFEGQMTAHQNELAILKETHQQLLCDHATAIGYIKRVQEDDTEFGETVVTGDPNGDQNIVPKRRINYSPSLYHATQGVQAEPGYYDRDLMSVGREQPMRRRHFVHYGTPFKS